jgi:hypothetical protein
MLDPRVPLASHPFRKIAEFASSAVVFGAGFVKKVAQK